MSGPQRDGDEPNDRSELDSGEFQRADMRAERPLLHNNAELVKAANLLWRNAVGTFGNRATITLTHVLSATSLIEEELASLADGLGRSESEGSIRRAGAALRRARAGLRELREFVSWTRRFSPRLPPEKAIALSTTLKVARAFVDPSSKFTYEPLPNSGENTARQEGLEAQTWLVRGGLYQNLFVVLGVANASALLLGTSPDRLHLHLHAKQLPSGTRVEITMSDPLASPTGQELPQESDDGNEHHGEQVNLALQLVGTFLRALDASLEELRPVDGGLRTILHLQAPPTETPLPPFDNGRPPSEPSRRGFDVAPPSSTRMPPVLLVLPDPKGALPLSVDLKRAGFAVDLIANGAEALSRISTHNYACVVTARDLPLMSGVEFIKAVRRLDLDVPVLFLEDAERTNEDPDPVAYGAFASLSLPFKGQDLLDTVRRATKARGLNRLRRLAAVHHELPEPDLPDRAALEVRFDRAIQGLWMAWQPMVRWSERSIAGFEALVRSTEPGLTEPKLLFEAAHKLGAHDLLGRAIRSRIAADLDGGWPGFVFVNLHSLDLNDNDLYSEANPLRTYADRVVYEVNEGTGLASVSGLAFKLRSIRHSGFRIAIDDLGSGYSNLSSFLQLNPDYVKIDASLVRRIHEAPRKRSLVRSLTQLCGRDLGAQVVCEGVETQQERDALSNMGIDLFQGFLFARPERGFQIPVLA
jgi:EAL domain-containing protein (putative c-di-GMP-specific phosphodiesterase class I)